MNVSSTGKTPELFDITVLSDGSDNVNYINNAPETKIVGSDTTCVSKRLFLSSETADDAFCTQLDFKWSCDNENVIISNSKDTNRPVVKYSIPKMLMAGESGGFSFIASDDTGVAEFTVKVNGVAVVIDEKCVRICFLFMVSKLSELQY